MMVIQIKLLHIWFICFIWSLNISLDFTNKVNQLCVSVWLRHSKVDLIFIIFKCVFVRQCRVAAHSFLENMRKHTKNQILLPPIEILKCIFNLQKWWSHCSGCSYTLVCPMPFNVQFKHLSSQKTQLVSCLIWIATAFLSFQKKKIQIISK